MEYESLKNWKYRVVKSFSIQTEIIPTVPIKTKFSSLTKEGILTIDKGFCWDGASGAIDTKNIMRGSCIHDAFCNWQHQGLISKEQREQADKLLKEIIKKDGMGKFRAAYIYWAIQMYVSIRY